jgi:hypothetical protein
VFQKHKPKRVKAIYHCIADNPDELTFTEGEVIVVDGEEDQEWWVSTAQGGPCVCVCVCVCVCARARVLAQ